MVILQKIFCLILGYAFGLIETGYIIGKTQNIDIRQYGSGNLGMTNTMRTLGKKAGVATFLGDGLKAIIAIIIVRLIFNQCDYKLLLSLYTGLGVILGHNFPFYMHFKGGKGIMASAGIVVACFDFKLFILALLTFAIVVGISKYVSLGSLCMITGFFINLVIFGQLGTLSKASGFNPDYNIETYAIALIMVVLAFIRHKENIKRLISGTERKIGEKKEAV